MITREQQERRHEIKVGLMILVGVAVIIFVIFAVGQQQGFLEDRYTLHVYLSRVNGLQTGAPVRLNGVRVGSVSGISFAKNGEDAQIKVTLEVLTTVREHIRKDSEAFIGTLGLLGDKFVSITMGSEEYPALENGDTLPGIDPVDIEKLIDESMATFDELKKTASLLKEISGKINRGEGTIGLLVNDTSLYTNLNESLQLFKTLEEQLNTSEGTLAKILRDTTMYDELYTFLKNTNTLTDSLVNGSGTAAKLIHDAEFYEKLVTNLDQLEEISKKINRGDGTMGKMVNDQQLYEDLVRVTAELDSLVKDVRKNPKRYLTVEVF